MNDPIYENNSYKVVLSDNVIGEDGQYAGRAGYGVVNKETGITEHTTMVLPQALFQADAFEGALGQLNEEEPEPEALVVTDIEGMLQ
jgi:hypothetical protein